MRCLVPALLFLACTRPAPAEPVRVAAAADLTEVFTELGARFEAETKVRVSFSFGSSGLLARQLASGAPFDLFAAANRGFVDQAVKAGACDGGSARDYARGTLALWSARPVSLDALNGEQVHRIALANPEHAPYGLAAKQTLEALGLWDRVQPKLVFSENVRQSLQFAETGNVDVAFVAYSNVVGRDAGAVLVLDEALHAPLQQAMVRCTRGANADGARRFMDFLDTPEAKALLRRSGFH